MRVAIVSERARGRGASEASWNLAVALQAAGMQVGYFFAEPSPEAEGSFDTAVQFGSWQRSNRAIRAMRHHVPGSARWFDEHLLRRGELAEGRSSLLACLERFSPDVVHVHNVGAVGGHLLVSSLRRRWPTLWTAHDRYPFELFHNRWEFDGEESTTWEYSPSGRPSDIGLQMFKDLPLEVPILSPSRWLASIGDDVLAESRHPIEVIPNLIPVADAPPAWDLAEMLDVDMVALAVISQPDYPLKGFDTVRQAVLQARSLPDPASARTANMALVVVTPQRLRLTSEGIYGLWDLHRMGIVPRAGYLDRSEMARVYASCDVLVLPSLIENMPNVVIEAAAVGVPSIASNVGGVPEVVESGKTGWLFPAGDEAALARCLVSAASDPAERARLGQVAQDQFGAEYSPAVVLERHLEQYRRAAAFDGWPQLQGEHPSVDVSQAHYAPRRTRRTPLRRRVVAIVRRVLRRLRTMHND